MKPLKRFLDFSGAIFLATLLSPVTLIVALLVLILDGRPVLYASERMKTPTTPFTLYKFRTMTLAPRDSGVSGPDKSARITRMGAFLRRSRLDEFPQLWNVIRGDMSLVGPRPPLRLYTDRFPKIYAAVLQSRPGITGLASVVYSRHEARLLARSTSPAETDAIYARACVPRKARLDLIYQAHVCTGFDYLLMLKTLFRSISLHRRKPRA